ncbi:MAG: hypothetical protein PHV53_10620 [Fermentimonas sp.]|nr:hypothetical protein [Fermentimonas sp.]
MERYFLINKETAKRGGFSGIVRSEIEGNLLLSEKDLMNITLTTDERVKALNGSEYVDKTESIEAGAESDPVEETQTVEESIK